MYAREDLIVRTEIIKFTARLAKSIAVAGIENKTIAAATGIFGDKGLEKVNDFISNFNRRFAFRNANLERFSLFK